MKAIVQPDTTNPPENCPNCNGQTEWTQNPAGEYVAVCYFCAHIFRSRIGAKRKK